jgi:hypothetical protein
MHVAVAEGSARCLWSRGKRRYVFRATGGIPQNHGRLVDACQYLPGKRLKILQTSADQTIRVKLARGAHKGDSNFIGAGVRIHAQQLEVRGLAQLLRHLLNAASLASRQARSSTT